MKSLTVPADTARLHEVTNFIDAELEKYDCPPMIQMQIDLAVEEIFVNIASYAYESAGGEAEVRCETLQDPTRIVIQFLDSGMPYDPLQREDADTSPQALMSRVGGLGILLVKKTMDEAHYAYEDGKNVLTIQKRLDAVT